MRNMDPFKGPVGDGSMFLMLHLVLQLNGSPMTHNLLQPDDSYSKVYPAHVVTHRVHRKEYSKIAVCIDMIVLANVCPGSFLLNLERNIVVSVSQESEDAVIVQGMAVGHAD